MACRPPSLVQSLAGFWGDLSVLPKSHRRKTSVACEAMAAADPGVNDTPDRAELWERSFELALVQDRVVLSTRGIELHHMNETAATLTVARAQLDQARAELDQVRAEFDQTRAKLGQTRAELDQVRADRDAARATIESMLGSASWRLTRPIRALRRIVRRH